MKFVRPLPFAEALVKLGVRSIVGADLTSAEWAYVPVALRERAFFSSRIESVRFLDRAKNALMDFLESAREEITAPDGTKTTALKTWGRARFVEQMREFAISEGMGPLDPEDAGTIKDIRSQRRLDLIFDVQTRQAHDYGNWKQGNNPAVLDEFPAQRFVRVRGVKEPRGEHRIHEGEVRLKSDVGFWTALNEDFGVPWGPWGWGCGHDVEDVDRDEAERLGLIDPGEKVQDVETSFNARLESSVGKLASDLLKRLVDALGDKVEIDSNGAIRWKESRSK
ncbi:MAG TPA: hypothetical protein PKM43_06905 [Verrucomicrobiota bacterium]|nr:hypothetical protein [Verrucomicrobiota bacterium]HRZ37771.1 hypothetical protein [Candidatus Paceibacterota bacterium]